jgi:hypothetical protein
VAIWAIVGLLTIGMGLFIQNGSRRSSKCVLSALRYLAFPVHHNTLPTIRQLDSAATETDSYSR